MVMRTITANINDLFGMEHASKEVTFELKDKYGNTLLTLSETTNTLSTLTIQLEVTEQLDRHYLLDLVPKSNKAIKFYLSNDTSDIDLKFCKYKIPNLSMFYEYIESTGTYKFKHNTEEIFRSFFAGENEFASQDEKNLINFYLLYVNDEIQNDCMMQLSEYLGAV